MHKIFAGLVALTLLGACSVSPPSGSGDTARMQSDFRAQNGFIVRPSPDPSRFLVMARGGGGGDRYFCAAGEYSRRRLNAGAADRVVVVAPEGSVGRSAVGFELVPSGTVSSTGSFTVSVRRAGENLRVSHAEALCRHDSVGVSIAR